MTDRSKFLGGSDVAAVLGISPWRTPLDLYLEKTEPRVEETDPARLKVLNRGKRLEPYILDMLEREHGIATIERNARYQDPDFPFLAAEIDAETLYGDEPQNIEIKTVHPFKVKEWGDEDTDSIPVHYTAQAMHGLMVTGRERCVFAVLIGDDLRLYRVDRDAEIIAGMREKEIAFWNDHVLAGVAPAPTNVADVLRMFARDSGTVLEATHDIASSATRLANLKAEIKGLQADVDQEEEAVKLFMADASVLTYQGQQLCSWKAQSARRLDQKALAADFPELVEQYKRVSETRVFRIK